MLCSSSFGLIVGVSSSLGSCCGLFGPFFLFGLLDPDVVSESFELECWLSS